MLLSRLLPADLALLLPHLTPIDLPRRMRLEAPSREIEHVYFLESGFVSVVANGDVNNHVEVGLIGREGMTGLAVVHGISHSASETYVQSAGAALRIPSAALSDAIERSASLRNHLLQFAHAFLVQVMQTARANDCGKIEERLARWLLMAHDRLDADELKITHEFLAVMLGVRRPGVTLALKILEKSMVISTSRGGIAIKSRAGLKRAANGAYGVAEAEFDRVVG